MNAMRTLKILYLLLAGICYLFFCLYLPQFSAYLLLCILFLPAVLFFAAHYSGAKLQAELVPPKPHAHIGEPFSCCVRLKNPTIFPISTVIFRIHLENETLTELDDVEFHEAVPPRQTVCIHVPVTPEHAGAVHVTLQSVQVLDTLLLFSHRKRFSAAFSVTALPEVPQPPASTSPLQAGEDAVMQPTTEPEEFLGVREYRSGDRMRAIHWKLSSCFPEPVVREYGIPARTPVTVAFLYAVQADNPQERGQELDAMLEALQACTAFFCANQDGVTVVLCRSDWHRSETITEEQSLLPLLENLLETPPEADAAACLSHWESLGETAAFCVTDTVLENPPFQKVFTAKAAGSDKHVSIAGNGAEIVYRTLTDSEGGAA